MASHEAYALLNDTLLRLSLSFLFFLSTYFGAFEASVNSTQTLTAYRFVTLAATV